MSDKSIETLSNLDLIANSLSQETFKLIDGQTKDAQFSNKMAILFLSHFVSILLYRSLSQPPKKEHKTKEQIAKFTIWNFGETKLGVQEAMSVAFSSAMNTYTGQQIEYYCQIRPIGPVMNKEPI